MLNGMPVEEQEEHYRICCTQAQRHRAERYIREGIPVEHHLPAPGTVNFEEGLNEEIQEDFSEMNLMLKREAYMRLPEARREREKEMLSNMVVESSRTLYFRGCTTRDRRMVEWYTKRTELTYIAEAEEWADRTCHEEYGEQLIARLVQPRERETAFGRMQRYRRDAAVLRRMRKPTRKEALERLNSEDRYQLEVLSCIRF